MSRQVRRALGSKAVSAATGAISTTKSALAYIKQLVNRSAIVGRRYYVDASVTASGAGSSWATAFKTITEAIAVATTAGDVIYVAPGDYDEGAVIAVATHDLKIIGPGIDNHNSALIWSSSASHHLMTINANNVEISGLGFTQTKDTYDAIRVASTADTYKCHIHHCRFDGYGQGEFAVHTGTTKDSPDIVVENCVFRSWQTSAIYANATRDIYRNNIFHVTTDKNGIDYIPNASSRPDGVIVDNLFSGVANATTTGIKFTAVPNNGTCTVARNMMAGTFDVTITQTASHLGVNNYVADASGGALIDPVT